jgi:uncharacterized protein
MTVLFEIETSDVRFVWHAPVRPERKTLPNIGEVIGYLDVEISKPGLSFALKPEPPNPPPRMFEETEYRLFAKAKNGKTISVRHEDPVVCAALVIEDGGSVCTGNVNFRSNVGRSRFSILVDGKPEFSFELEVFPSKLDYKSDYELLLAETRGYLSELIFEYLKPTFKLSTMSREAKADQFSWVFILRQIIDALETASRQVAKAPVRALVSDAQLVSVEKISRIDASVRKSVMRGTGAGPFLSIEEVPIKQRILHRTSCFTLDTSEHRWISYQLGSVKERLQGLIETESKSTYWRSSGMPSKTTERQSVVVNELRLLLQRLQTLEKLEPFDAATVPPPPGFASLQLMSAPGYKECYQLLMALKYGLKIDDGITRLALKEISVLYEYWAFLTLVATIAKETGSAIPAGDLIKASISGLKVALQKGKQSDVVFNLAGGRKITVTYNKPFPADDESILIPQKPDIMVTIEGANWPTLTLLLDAKYRVRCDERILAFYKSPGPDEDAINALHRYRDAILEIENVNNDRRPKRTVIQAAAIFPYVDSDNSFTESRLWRGLEKIGIGAIPLVPTEKRYLQKWLASVLRSGQWSLADRAINHIAVEKREDWRRSASEAVLIGVLPTENVQERLIWIRENACYYIPLIKSNPRQYVVKQVAIYEPLARGGKGAVVLVGDVSTVSVVRRDDISTPWSSKERGQGECVLYKLTNVRRLRHPIVNAASERMSVNRWTSRLALERAKSLNELFLETEPEWRLYEALTNAGLPFELRAGRIKALDEFGTQRAIFCVGANEVTYSGADGFSCQRLGTYQSLPNVEEVVRFLERRT